MSILYLLIPMALLIASLFLLGFIWATQNGQYDHLDTDQFRPLIEDAPSAPLHKDQPHG